MTKFARTKWPTAGHHRGVASAVSLLAFVLPVFAASERPPTLWYDRPANYWEEALPVGHGSIGAMIYGGVLRDHIQLNEGTIWPNGSVSGSRARSGIAVDLTCAKGALTNATVLASVDGACTVRSKTPLTAAGSRSRPDGGGYLLTLRLPKGESYSLVPDQDAAP